MAASNRPAPLKLVAHRRELSPVTIFKRLAVEDPEEHKVVVRLLRHLWEQHRERARAARVKVVVD
jgi:hypothetical protein